MKGVINDFSPDILLVDRYYNFNKKLFGFNEVTEQEIEQFAREVTNKIITEIDDDE